MNPFPKYQKPEQQFQSAITFEHCHDLNCMTLMTKGQASKYLHLYSLYCPGHSSEAKLQVVYHTTSEKFISLYSFGRSCGQL